MIKLSFIVLILYFSYGLAAVGKQYKEHDTHNAVARQHQVDYKRTSESATKEKNKSVKGASSHHHNEVKYHVTDHTQHPYRDETAHHHHQTLQKSDEQISLHRVPLQQPYRKQHETDHRQHKRNHQHGHQTVHKNHGHQMKTIPEIAYNGLEVGEVPTHHARKVKHEHKTLEHKTVTKNNHHPQHHTQHRTQHHPHHDPQHQQHHPQHHPQHHQNHHRKISVRDVANAAHEASLEKKDKIENDKEIHKKKTDYTAFTEGGQVKIPQRIVPRKSAELINDKAVKHVQDAHNQNVTTKSPNTIITVEKDKIEKPAEPTKKPIANEKNAPAKKNETIVDAHHLLPAAHPPAPHQVEPTKNKTAPTAITTTTTTTTKKPHPAHNNSGSPIPIVVTKQPESHKQGTHTTTTTVHHKTTTKKPITHKFHPELTDKMGVNSNSKPPISGMPKVPKKPKITYSYEDKPEIRYIPHVKLNKNKSASPDLRNINGQVETELLLDSNGRNNNRKYIFPIVAFIFALPLLLGFINIAIRRFRNYWYTRHYRRMDFLVDGMYNC